MANQRFGPFDNTAMEAALTGAVMEKASDGVWAPSDVRRGEHQVAGGDPDKFVVLLAPGALVSDRVYTVRYEFSGRVPDGWKIVADGAHAETWIGAGFGTNAALYGNVSLGTGWPAGANITLQFDASGIRLKFVGDKSVNTYFRYRVEIEPPFDTSAPALP